jgi:hypothetical protein
MDGIKPFQRHNVEENKENKGNKGNKGKFFELPREYKVGRLMLGCPAEVECYQKKCPWEKVHGLRISDKIQWLGEQNEKSIDRMLKSCPNATKFPGPNPDVG